MVIEPASKQGVELSKKNTRTRKYRSAEKIREIRESGEEKLTM